MKIRFLCLVLSFVMVLGMATVIMADEAEEPSGTLTITTIVTHEPGLSQVIADFEEAYPGVDVECEYISDLTAFSTSVVSRFVAGTASDICDITPGRGNPESVYQVSEAGYIMDLSDMPWTSDMYEDAKHLFMYDDKVYAYDFGFCPLSAVIYNKDIFEEYGLSIPKTFDELVEICETIKAAGIIPMAYSGGEVFVNLNDVIVIVGNEVVSQDPEWMDKMLAGETTFADTPGFRTAIEEFKLFIDNGYLSPGAASMNQTEMIAEFASGEAAMMFGYGGHAGMIKADNPDINLSEFAWPGTTEDKTRVMLQAAGGMSIPVTNENPELAELFLEFWRQPEEQAKFADGSSSISVSQIKEAKTEGNYAELTGIPFILDITTRWPNTTFGAKWGASLQGLITGQKTVDDVIADADMLFNE